MSACCRVLETHANEGRSSQSGADSDFRRPSSRQTSSTIWHLFLPRSNVSPEHHRVSEGNLTLATVKSGFHSGHSRCRARAAPPSVRVGIILFLWCEAFGRCLIRRFAVCTGLSLSVVHERMEPISSLELTP